MISRLAIASLTLIVFSSCARDTDTTSKYGACNQSFIDDHNAIVSGQENLRSFEKEVGIKPTDDTTTARQRAVRLALIKVSCKNFQSRHAGVSCVAEIGKLDQIISGSKFDEHCSSVDTALEQLLGKIASGKLSSTPRSISAPSLSAPSLSAPSVPAASLSAASVSYPLLSGIKIKETVADYKIVVLDYKKLLSLANKNEMIVERGKVYDPVSSGPYRDYPSSKQKINCDVTTEESNGQKSELNPNPSPESNPVLSVMDYSETAVDDEPGKQSRFLELSFNETNLKIHCTKEEPETDYTWAELQYTFSKIIEVKKIETGATISSGATNKDRL
ncbi:MAG: hypothetical protein IPK68_00675 [Bdellovibrionales bacterium]|nr:hypothetical protein [Bdellovibrionales bacterium]